MCHGVQVGTKTHSFIKFFNKEEISYRPKIPSSEIFDAYVEARCIELFLTEEAALQWIRDRQEYEDMILVGRNYNTVHIQPIFKVRYLGNVEEMKKEINSIKEKFKNIERNLVIPLEGHLKVPLLENKNKEIGHIDFSNYSLDNTEKCVIQ